MTAVVGIIFILFAAGLAGLVLTAIGSVLDWWPLALTGMVLVLFVVAAIIVGLLGVGIHLVNMPPTQN